MRENVQRDVADGAGLFLHRSHLHTFRTFGRCRQLLLGRCTSVLVRGTQGNVPEMRKIHLRSMVQGGFVYPTVLGSVNRVKINFVPQ